MVFVTAGMGGGPARRLAVVAGRPLDRRVDRSAVVTLPFAFEGNARMQNACRRRGSRANVDALVVIPNDAAAEDGDAQMTVVDAFRMADDILRQGFQGTPDLVTQTGLITLDFADVKAIMGNAGTALMASGEATGENAWSGSRPGRDLKRAAGDLHRRCDGCPDQRHRRRRPDAPRGHRGGERHLKTWWTRREHHLRSCGASTLPEELRLPSRGPGLRSGPSERGFRRVERPRATTAPGREERGNRE